MLSYIWHFFTVGKMEDETTVHKGLTILHFIRWCRMVLTNAGSWVLAFMMMLAGSKETGTASSSVLTAAGKPACDCQPYSRHPAGSSPDH